MSGNRDELPERTGGDTEGSSRSRQSESQEAIAERLGIDPEQVATRDTLDEGIERRLTDEGATAAEQQLRQETAADREFVRPSDLQANVDRETFSAQASLTESGRQRAQQRQAEQLRQEAAQQSDRFGESDFVVDRSGDEVSVEPTEAARRREAAEQLAAQSDVVSNVDPNNVELTDDGARLTAAGVERAQEAAAASELGVSPDEIDLEGQTVDLSNDAQRSIAVDRIEQQVGGALSSAVREQGDGVFGLTDYISDVTGFDDTVSVDEQDELSDIIGTTQQQAQQQARQEARQDFAESIESGSAFDDLPDGVDPASLIDNVDPNEDIVREGDSLALSDDVQGRINSQLESDALQQQRREFAQALESGEAFESGEAPDGLGSVDPQTDVAVEDGQLTLADDTQAELIESQIRSQVGATPNLNTDDVLQRAASQDEILRAVEEQIESQTGTDTRSGLIEDANLSVNADGTIEADRVLLNSRRFDDFRDVSTLRANTDLLDGADLSVNATEAFSGRVEQSIAQQISERNVVDVSSDQIDISGGNVSTQTPESLTIENDQITADGLTESGQSDFARRQLQSIQTTEGVSVDTPVGSQPFANVSAQLAQAAEGQGSLSSATRIVAASDTVSNVGDLDDLPDARIIEGLEPEQAEERLGIDASTVREAQSDIESRRQQLESDPGSVLQDIADNQDEFINDSTRIGVAGERGQRIRQAARTQLNELEADIAAGDDDVAPGDVGLTLTDDLSGIRSIDEGGRQAIAQSVDEQLPNFDSSEIDVGVSDGQITTSIEDSVRDRFVQNAQRVQEIQVRNEIADETEGIGRRDIEVDAGEGVSPSDELVTETLGTDVNADIESFDQLEAAANIQARQQARQQAIQQVDSQTIGAIDPRNVSVERTETGFEANVSGAAAQSVDLSAVNAGQTTTVQTTNQTDTNVSLGNLSNVTGAVGLNTPEQIDTGSGEEFGDAVPDFIEDPARGFQSGVSQIGAQLGGGVGNVVEQVGEFTAPVEQGENFVGQTPAESTGNLAEGAIEGTANLIGSAPVVGVEATEFGIFAAQNPGETAEQLPDAISERALLAGEQATSSPAEFTGQIVGSGAGSGALFKATQGTRLGTVTRATLQPGEELVKAGVRRGALGERAVDVTPGVTRGQIDRDFGSERGQTSPLLGAERLLDDSGDGDTTIEIEDTGPRADVDNDPRTGLDDIEQAAARGRQRSVDIDQDLDTSVRSVTRDQDIQSVSQDAEIRSPSRSVGGGSDSRPISEIDPDLTPRETQLAAQLDTPTGDFRRRVDIEDRTPDIDLRRRGRGETGSATELISRTEAATDTVSVEQQTPEVAFDSEPGSVNAGGEQAETVETGVESSIESQFRQSVGETGQQRFFEREGVGVEPGSDTDTRLGVTPGSDIGVGSQPRTGVETGVGVDPRTAIDSRAESRTGLETGVETAVETATETTTGLETGIETQIETERETEREREIDLGLETEIETERDAQQPPEDDDEGENLFASSDDLFDSGILSGSEALQESFGR